MSDKTQARRALVETTEKVANRRLNVGEERQLYEEFDRSTGSNERRALTAITRVLKTSETDVRLRFAESDNTDRSFRDLLDVLDTLED